MTRWVLLADAVLVIAGCNAVAEFGADMEAAGNAVERAVNKAKK